MAGSCSVACGCSNSMALFPLDSSGAFRVHSGKNAVSSASGSWGGGALGRVVRLSVRRHLAAPGHGFGFRRCGLVVRAQLETQAPSPAALVVTKEEEAQAASPVALVVTKEEEKLSRGTLIWRAAKPPIYSVALIPCSVAAAAAYVETGEFLGSQYLLMLLSGALIIAWLNFSNDVFDFEAGIDGNKKESVVNMTGRSKEVYLAGNICLALGLGGFLWAAQPTGNLWIPALAALSVSCGFLYQGPSFRWGHLGLGEPLAFVAAGPCITTAFYLGFAPVSGSLPLSLTIAGCSVLVGITTGLILLCSHFHQIEEDIAANKISPLVRLGTLNGSRVVAAVIVGMYSTVAGMVALKALPLSCAVTSLLTLPVGKLVVDFVTQNHADKEKIFMAKYFAVRLHVAHGMALAAGLLLSALLPLPDL